MEWKLSLDRWLTSPPEEYYDNWVDDTINLIPNTKYQLYESWILDYKNRWFDRLFTKGLTPKEASKVITRGLLIFKPK